MATKKKTLNKAFISVGKVKNDQGKEVEEFITISEELAKYVGATYSTKPPEARKIVITKGALAGRTITREHSVAITGRPYQLGYLDGVVKGTGNGKKQKTKIKWVSIHVPKGITLRSFVNLVMTKFKKKPAILKTPSGVSAPLSSGK
jgi:hypothetical protein